MKAASEREEEIPTTIALENTAQNPQEKNEKRKTYFHKSRMIKVTQKNYSNCMLGNKDQKKIVMVKPFILAPISLIYTQFNAGRHLVENWHRGFGSCWHSHHAEFHPWSSPLQCSHSFHLDVGQAQPPHLGCRHHARAKNKEWRSDCQSL